MTKLVVTCMKLTFLDISAANAYPEAYYNCHICKGARTYAGPSLQKWPLINYDLLIDLGPDIMKAGHMHNISLTNLKYCLIEPWQTIELGNYRVTAIPDTGVAYKG
jgi:hypothetical protein